MKTLRTIFYIVLLVTMSFLNSLDAQMPAGPNRPAEVPEGYVITPVGYFHPSCVIEVRKGESILENGLAIRHADGSVAYLPPCPYPHYRARGEAVATPVGDVKTQTIAHSWIEDANFEIGTSYGELTANWDVPQPPSVNNGEIIYFFPGLCVYGCNDQNPQETILQPVLGWNAYFSGSWGISSVDCCYNGNQLYSTPTGAAPGDIIGGSIKSTCAAGTQSCPTWTISTSDGATGQLTTLANTSSDGQTFNWAFGGALEVYSVSTCTNLPSSTALTFNNVSLYDYNFNLVSNPSWVPTYWSVTPACSYNVQTSASQVTLDYGTTMPLAASPVVSNIQVTTNGGGPSGTNYIITMTISDSTAGSTIHYSMSACGLPRVLGSTSPGQLVYKCTGRSANDSAELYATASGHNPSPTIQVNF